MPDEATLRQWYLVEDITYREMADRWAVMPGGDTATPQAFAAKISRYDWHVPRTMKHSGTDLTPWMGIRPEHQDKHDIQMLRKEAARRAGKVFDAKWNARIDAYLRGLNEDDCVVEYRRDTIKGWWHVKCLATDTDYVRLPA